ncbi:hypothetical protein AND_006782 [Anopheles darlingi]|uniref:C2h2-type zn-finger protein n=1 Tax=Anopheles darlingi TaxID=43151 RepID=W5JF95_ANODA|nr:hypothetical protein AND_006782 [Anopheles darlingi]
MQDFSLEIDPTSVCRFCLDHERPMELLFDLQFLPELVASLTQLEISFDDPFSKLICEQCGTLARSIFEFREKCIDSQRVQKEWMESRILEEDEQTSSTLKVGVEYIVCDEDDNRENDNQESLSVDAIEEQTINTLKVGVEYIVCDEDDNRENQENQELLSVDAVEGQTDSSLKVGVEYVVCHEEDEQGNENKDSLSDDEARLAELTIQMINDGEDERRLREEHGYDEEQIINMKTDPVDEVADDDELPKISKCPYCVNAYSSYELLGLHLNSHQRDQWHCPECDEVLEDKDEFIEHLRMHGGEAFKIPYEISIQQLQPDQENDLQVKQEEQIEHRIKAESTGTTKGQKRKRTKKPTQLVECGKRKHSDLQQTINQDRQTHLNTDSALNDAETTDEPSKGRRRKVFLCNVCGHNCKSASNLAVHLRRHNAQFVCHCSHCGKGFPRRADLTSHMRQHTGEKPFVCKTCGRGFTRKDKLTIHLRTHTGEKPYSCPCGRSFAQRNDMKIHQKRNTCGQNFDLSKLISPKVSICVVSPPSSP